MDQNAKQIAVERLKASANVLITVGTNPTVDALSAAIGFSLLLGKLDKHASAVFSGQIPPAIGFLQPEKRFDRDLSSLRDFIIALDKDKADKLRYKVEENQVKIFITPYRTTLSEQDLQFSQGDFNVDTVVALGVSRREDLDNAIKANGRILHDAAVITINSGEMGTDMGSINWQDPSASSLSEMLVSISEAFGSGLLDEQIATAFLTGIVAATERFSNPKTTPKVMTMSAQLMAAGANQQLIASHLTAGQPVPPPPPVPTQSAPKDDNQLKIDHGGLPPANGDNQAPPPPPPPPVPPQDQAPPPPPPPASNQAPSPSSNFQTPNMPPPSYDSQKPLTPPAMPPMTGSENQPAGFGQSQTAPPPFMNQNSQPITPFSPPALPIQPPPPRPTLTQLEEDISSLAQPKAPDIIEPEDKTPEPPEIKPSQSKDELQLPSPAVAPPEPMGDGNLPSQIIKPRPIMDSYQHPEPPKIGPSHGHSPNDLVDDPTMGGTFNATSEQAHEESINELLSRRNKKILSHPSKPMDEQNAPPERPISRAQDLKPPDTGPTVDTYESSTESPKTTEALPPTPAEPAPAPVPDVEAARAAVEAAFNAQPFDPAHHPLQSSGSSPLPQEAPAQNSGNSNGPGQFQIPG